MSYTINKPHQRRAKADKEDELTEIQVLIISAEGLKNVKHVTKMRPYAEVYVERHVHVAKTKVDDAGGLNPRWNQVLTVRFHKELLRRKDVTAALNVDIYAHGHLREKPVGSAGVLLCDVLKGGDAAEPADNPIQCMAVNVWRPSGRPHGILNLWVPPTGRFLTRRDSDQSSSGKKVEEEEERVDDDLKSMHA